MSKLIPQPFIDELIDRADIVEVVGARVALKKAGADYKGLCPFHDEKTPSFTVSPDKGFYHCFGCHAGGNAIGFLMEHDHMSFPEAVETLAGMLGLEIPVQRSDADRSENQSLLDVLGEADRIYRQSLRKSPEAIDYLKGRGVDGTVARRFAIGYAPDAWDTVLRQLGRGEPRTTRLVQAGLVIANDSGRHYDRFRDRVMFPIRDRRGKVIGFGGRVLGDGEPKYLNSPETNVFHKGRALYGLFEAHHTPGRHDEIVVVEGYLDVVSLAQHGIEPVVATLGTATSAEHLRQLTLRYKRIVFCFDGDRAGRAAAWRALETALPYAGGEVELAFLLLPEGEDPDSLVRNRGADAFRDLQNGATALSDYFVNELGRQADPGSVDGRAKLVALARPLLKRVPASVYRNDLTTKLAEAVGTSVENLAALLENVPKTTKRPQTPLHRKSTLVRKTIALALHYPSAASNIGHIDGLDDVDQPGAGLLRRILELARDNPAIKPAQLIEHFRDDEEGRHLQRLAAEVPLDDEQAATEVLRGGLERLAGAQRHKESVEELKERALSEQTN